MRIAGSDDQRNGIFYGSSETALLANTVPYCRPVSRLLAEAFWDQDSGVGSSLQLRLHANN